MYAPHRVYLQLLETVQRSANAPAALFSVKENDHP